MSRPLFPLGQVVATPGAMELAHYSGAILMHLLERHVVGDWGELDAHDRKANDQAVKSGTRILSAYSISGGKIWIITEWDRSVTTLLLPDEY